MKKAIPNLESKKELDEVVFHLKGIVETLEAISAQVQALDSTIDTDLHRATDAMGALQAEIYTHLAYHMKELRRPFLLHFRLLCKKLEEEELG